MNLALLHYKLEEFAGERGRDFVGVHHFGFIVEDVEAAQKSIEKAGGKHWMGEPAGGGFYEVKFFDPDGVVFDITERGWTGAAHD
jgi:predicted enzyme related to lactoylglutathione lyase